jgi:hypothetical protein
MRTVRSGHDPANDGGAISITVTAIVTADATVRDRPQQADRMPIMCASARGASNGATIADANMTE